ncbi:hypothetical protein HK096_003794 [Nowakowskiella sp. JEL0078]|nr:hypothetical protein HK096_003794 [Nowakowskiella sp. JEL0078]
MAKKKVSQSKNASPAKETNPVIKRDSQSPNKLKSKPRYFAKIASEQKSTPAEIMNPKIGAKENKSVKKVVPVKPVKIIQNESEDDVMNLPSEDEDESELEWEDEDEEVIEVSDVDEMEKEDELSELDDEEMEEFEKELLGDDSTLENDELQSLSTVGAKRKRMEVDDTIAKMSESAEDEEESDEEGIKIIDAKLTKKEKKAKSKNITQYTKRGVVYLSRVPHGFYEKEMYAYFSQFGEVTRLRLSRNRKGESKHYAFIEFSNEGDAKVVAETMDNYLMFNQLLKCKFVPEEQVHENAFLGWTLDYSPKPWAHISRKAHNSVICVHTLFAKLILLKPKPTKVRVAKARSIISKEEKKRDKLRELGIDYDYPGYAGDLQRRAKFIDSISNKEAEKKLKTTSKQYDNVSEKKEKPNKKKTQKKRKISQ